MLLPVVKMASTIPTETEQRPRVSSVSRALVVAGYLVSAATFVGLVLLHLALFLLSDGGYVIFGLEPSVLASWPPSTPKILAFVAAAFLDLAIAVSVGASWFVGLSREEGTEAMKRGLYLFASLSFATWLFTSALISQWIRYY